MRAIEAKRFSGEWRVQIQGHYELKFEAVREAFAALFDNSQERGAALCIQVGGDTVICIEGHVALD